MFFSKVTYGFAGLCFMASLFLAGLNVDAGDRKATYVGSESCKECHEAEYDNFQANARKAKSYESIRRMRKGLTDTEIKSCFKCHTTGYGEPGGFKSAEETPHVKNAGCEVCHGPGSIHAESGDPDKLGSKISVEVCKTCHSAERVRAFRFKPMLYGGAH